jgi:hypothetical protein
MWDMGRGESFWRAVIEQELMVKVLLLRACTRLDTLSWLLRLLPVSTSLSLSRPAQCVSRGKE